MQAPARPSFLRRAARTTALYVVGIPTIVLGMLLVFAIVAYDTVDKRFREMSARW
jgi:ABC-type dipeptide/oligopeptide/nickel transport system permease component